MDCTVDPRIWEVDQVGDHPIYITGHLRDEDRVKAIGKEHRGAVVIDLAHDTTHTIVWRKNGLYGHAAFLRNNGLRWHPVWRLKDLQDGVLEPGPYTHALDTVTHYLLIEESPVILHCAAGLRRAPHVVYGFLREQGYSEEDAWDLVKTSRPLAFRDENFIRGIEDILAARRST